MLNGLFSTLGQIVTNVVSYFVSIFNGVVTLIWDAAANDGAGQVTLLGSLLLIAVVMTSFWVAFRIIRNLVRMRG